MINIQIEREDHTKMIRSFHVSGHALYAEHGNDIVCAGVSAVTVGTVNAIQTLAQIPLRHRMRDGLLQVEIPRIADEAKRSQVQLLLESMIVMLQSIEQNYGHHVQIHEQFHKGG